MATIASQKPMKGSTMLATLQQSLFRTLKYRPEYPHNDVLANRVRFGERRLGGFACISGVDLAATICARVAIDAKCVYWASNTNGTVMKVVL